MRVSPYCDLQLRAEARATRVTRHPSAERAVSLLPVVSSLGGAPRGADCSLALFGVSVVRSCRAARRCLVRFLALCLLHGSYPLISYFYICVLVLRSSHLPASPGSSLNSNLNMVGETGQRRRDLPATGRPAGVHTARRSARPRAAAWRRSCRSGLRCATPCYRAPPPSAR